MHRLIKTVLISLALSLPLLAVEFKFVQFDVPDARLTRPFGVNASAQIVGLYRDSSNAPHGFLRNLDGTYTTIDYPGATFTNASGINARGDIVGRWTDAGGKNHGYLLTPDGSFTSFDPTAPCVVTTLQTVAHGINDIGDIVGRCFDANGKELGWLWRHDGTFKILDDPSYLTTDAHMVTNRDEIVGDYSDTLHVVHGFTWTDAGGFVTLDFPGNPTGVRAMNERGDITGVYGTGAVGTRYHGFLLRNGVFETVDYPGSVDNGAPPTGGTLVINNSGLIVGGFVDANGKEHGFAAIQCPASGFR